jgi:uncharacterized membrane protein YhhN
MKKLFLYLFFLASAGEIISTFVAAPLLHTICKPALIVLLGLYYWTETQSKQTHFSFSILLAILFSGVGDVLLMFQENGQLFFMLGLVSFLVAHIFYIFTYREHRLADSSRELQGIQKVRFGFPIVFAGIGLVSILFGHLGDLKIPVMVYATVLTLMVLNALIRFERTNTASFAMVFGGAILFMISDSLLAVNKFLEPLPMESFWIMLTYISGQFFIVRGLLKHEG